MPVVTLKSSAITNATATPMVPNSANLVNGNLRASQGFANIGSTDSVGSTYRVGRIRSSDRMEVMRLYTLGIATTPTADIGLYDKNDVNGGAVVDADFFASAQALSAALNGTDVTFEAAAAGGSIANGEKRVWEGLGLTADPFKEYDVALTLTAVPTASGVVLVRMQIVSGE